MRTRNNFRSVEKKAGLDMTKGEPFKLLIVYSFPILLGSLFQQLYNLFDTVIVGRLLGPDALAAVGNTGPMNFLVLGFLYGMTSGFAVITAQKFGAHDEDGVKKSVAMNIVLNLASGLAITILACAFTMPLLRAIHTPDTIIGDSFRYIIVIFSGILVTVLYNGCTCVLRAVGDSKTPLYFLIVSSLLNIVLDIVFISKFKWGVAGAAWATVISQAVSGVASLVWCIVRYPILRVKREHYKAGWSFASRHLKIGMNMGFQFSITAIGTIVLEGALNKFGATKIAAFTAAQKVEQLVTVAAGVMGVTIANYGGQNLGAGRIDRIKEGVTKSVIISVGFAIFSALLAWIFNDQLVGFFLDKSSMTPERWTEILDAARVYLRICSVFFPVLFVIFVYRNILQSIGKGFWPLMGGVFELFARSIAAYTLPALMGFAGICAAEPLAWAAAAIPLAIAYYITISRFILKAPA
ncbi:MAG TPA: MATE family efflux transporter [Treponema sp.]|nr:MATE family efflux transporter [Treponema sp.]